MLMHCHLVSCQPEYRQMHCLSREEFKRNVEIKRASCICVFLMLRMYLSVFKNSDVTVGEKGLSLVIVKL